MIVWNASSAKLDVVLRQPDSFDRLRHEEPLRDLELLVLGVPRELDHLHAVAQSRRDRVERFAVQMNITFDRSNGTSR